MKAIAQKKPSESNNKPVSRPSYRIANQTTLVSLAQSNNTLIQCKPICPCDGGCPSCQNGLPIQPKLTIGQPGDKYEQEADRVAEEVMRMPDPIIQTKPTVPFANGPSCGDEEIEELIQPQPIAEMITPLIQRQTEAEQEEEEWPIMTKGVSSGTQRMNNDLSVRLNYGKGGGQPLAKAERNFMERRFGADFSGVRVHTDSNASQMNRELNARAFTYGKDIYFNIGRYKPNTVSGNTLLAHELTHVVQQNETSGQPELPISTWPDHTCIQMEAAVPEREGTAVASPTWSATPASPEETITQAIQLFAVSSQSATLMGDRVLELLFRLHRESEIGYERLRRAGAQARPGRMGWMRSDIAVSREYSTDVVRTSILLVHEAFHHLLTERPLVEQELEARELQIDYYLWLRRTFGDSISYDILNSETMRGHSLRNRLVDYIISRGYGRPNPRIPSIDVQWIRNHLTDWGGLMNRMANTRRVYLQILLRERGSLDVILDILESEESSMDFGVIMIVLGRRLRRAFRRVSLDQPEAGRIERLELRHHVNFGILHR